MRAVCRARPVLASIAAAVALCACGAGCLTARIRYDEEEMPSAAAREAADRSGTRERFLTYTGDRRVAGDLEATLRLYRRDDGAEVLLVPMVHYADAAFYDAIARRIAGADVVLLEGGPARADVADGTPGAPEGPPPAPSARPSAPTDDTARIFGALDLASQPEGAAVGPKGPRYESGDVDPAELSARIAAVQRSGEATEAQDFPGASFSWDRFWYRLFGRGEHWKKVWRHAFATRLEPTSERPIQALLIDPRNDALLGKLDGALAGAPGSPPEPPLRRALRVVVPWGAEHMPGIERGLFARRFSPVSAERLTAWRVRSYESP